MAIAEQDIGQIGVCTVPASFNPEHVDTSNELETMLRTATRLAGSRWIALLEESEKLPAIAAAVNLPWAIQDTLSTLKVWHYLHRYTNGERITLITLDEPNEKPTEQIYAIKLIIEGARPAILLAAFVPAISLSAPQWDTLELLTQSARLALSNTRLKRRIARLTSHLTVVDQLGRRTTSFLDRQHLYQQITELICTSLGYDHTQLLLVDKQRQRIELVHASGTAGEQLTQQGFSEVIGGPGIIARVVTSGQHWVCNRADQDSLFQFHWLLADTASEMAVPLKIADQVIGVLDVQSDRPNAFDADDLFLLQIAATQIAPALEFVRLLSVEYHERILATTLCDVSRVIGSSLELDQVLDLILQQLERVVPYSGARINLAENDDTMCAVAAKGYTDSETIKRMPFKIADVPLGRLTYFEQETIVIDDVHTDPRWVWLSGLHQIRSWCCVPLVIRGRSIGTLNVAWYQPGFYTEEHARVVRAFADQAAVAIENARLYAAIKDFTEQLEGKVEERTVALRVAQAELAQHAAQLQALVHRVVMVQETERQRIANDLHDGVIQSILAVVYRLQIVKRHVPTGQADQQAHVDACQDLLDHIQQEMKRIIYALRPRALDEVGLVAALHDLASTQTNCQSTSIRFDVAGTEYMLPDDVELAIYRIAQEALNNSLVHSAANCIEIAITFEAECVRTHVRDNGRGFDAHQIGRGLGLSSMRERAQAIGGSLRIESTMAQGTSVLFELPAKVLHQEPTQCLSVY